MYNLDPFVRRKLSKEEQEIVKYIKPKYQKQFAKLSSHKRATIIKRIVLDLQRRGVDTSSLKFLNSSSFSFAFKKYSNKNKKNVQQLKYSKFNKNKTNKNLNEKSTDDFNNNTSSQKKFYSKTGSNLGSGLKKSNVSTNKVKNNAYAQKMIYSKIGAKLDSYLKKSNVSTNINKREDVNEVQKRYHKKIFNKTKGVTSQKALSLVKSLVKKIFTAFSSSSMYFLIFIVLAIVLIIFLVIVVVFSIFMFGSYEEEKFREQNQAIYGTYSISKDVEQYRDKILAECKKYHREEYIDLYLAVVMQESGGKGTDIFQCSESLGKPRNSISLDLSIKQGVKYLSGMLKRAKPKNPKDIAKIKIALQGYNFGGGYIDFIMRGAIESIIKSGGGDKKWTQQNVLAYQKLKANGKEREENVDTFGPYAYGDAYYTEHVLRYYPLAQGFAFSVKAGVASKVEKAKRLSWLFGGSPPSSSSAVQKYLTRINVPIINEKGKKSSMVLTVHKKLASEFKAIFEEMVSANFPIKPASTCAYVWKTIIGTNSISQHSYGIAIDINWNDNPCFYNTNVNVSGGYGSYRPGTNKYSVTPQVIKIWKSHGFGWGGDWTGKKDTMHFSYTE